MNKEDNNAGNQKNKSELIKIGDQMADGTIYAGLSPDTGMPLYAQPKDARLKMEWADAASYAADFKGHGHVKGEFRLPSKGELNVLFKNRAKIGGFDLDAEYWSGEEDRFFADDEILRSEMGPELSEGYVLVLSQKSSGQQFFSFKLAKKEGAVRLVRTEPLPHPGLRVACRPGGGR